MSAINFPDPSQSPWTNSSTGITYTYSNGVWKALSSEETFLKQADAESTYLKQADANFVSLSDGGTQQVISGGGGLNVDGDVQKKGNTVPSAVMGASAPSNPGICDFWTDTSGDTPVLKSWNGTEWVEVGSSGASEFAPVISNVTLTENDTTGDRFTSQTFDVDITMLREGEPFSQKGLKGEVTASFEQRPTTQPVASNNPVTFPNNSKTTNYASYARNAFQRVPVWAPGLTEGSYEWYTYHYSQGRNAYGYFITMNIDDVDSVKTEIVSSITNGNANEMKYGKYYPARPGGIYEYIFYWADANEGMYSFRARRRVDVTGSSWSAGWQNHSRPWYDEATNEYYWTNDNYLYRGDEPAQYSYTARTSNMGYMHGQGSSMCAVGNGKVVALRNYNGTQYSHTFPKQFSEGQGTQYQHQFPGQYEYAKFVDFVNGHFWIAMTSGRLYRSSNAIHWTEVSIQRLDGYGGSILVSYLDVDPNTNELRAWTMTRVTPGGYYGRYIFKSNNNGATWNYTWGDPKGQNFFQECVPHFGDGKVVFVENGDHSGYDRMAVDYYPYSEQTVTLQGTGEGYSELNVGDVIRLSGSTSYEKEGRITSISGTDIGINSGYIYQSGDVIEAKYPTSSGQATRYLVIDSTGAVSGTIGSDPGYVTVGPSTTKTLTFPATFDTGNSPDDELPAGTVFKVSAQATNSIGSSEFGPSNIITPA